VDHHEFILRGIQYIVTRIGKDSTQFLPLIIPSILNQVSLEGGGPGLGVAGVAAGIGGDGPNSGPQYIKGFYDCLKTIIDCVPQCIPEYQNMIFDTIEQVILNQHQHVQEVIELLIFLNMRSSERYLPQMNFILPKVLHLIDSKRYSTEQMGLRGGASLAGPAQGGLPSKGSQG
jgi:hypothetical protein